jgi:hypothetical protein
MSRLAVRRIAVMLLLLLTLAPSLTWAGAHRSEDAVAPREGASLAERSLLSALWSFFKGVWEAEGGSLDPNGQPRPNEGGSLDPSGSTTDNGGSLDPDG